MLHKAALSLRVRVVHCFGSGSVIKFVFVHVCVYIYIYLIVFVSQNTTPEALF